MDYDGSDNQGNNLQLTGEARSKSSSVPRPYAFPRFDFEDSIQGNLRFDSLVESEVFLDIQSQENNQWIEDFSRGSNVIEFSSSASESCSITRINNVWSEATSLESVELLLKSVGQEQIASKHSNTDYSTTFNELTGLKKMEPKIEHDNVDSGYMRISDASGPQDELLKDFPELDDDFEAELSQVEKDTTSQVNLGQIHQGSGSLCVDALKEDHGAPVTVGDILLGTKCDDKDEKENKCIVHEKHEGSGSMCVDALEDDHGAQVIEEDISLGTECDHKDEKETQCIVHEAMNRTEESPSQSAVPVQIVNFNRISGLLNSEHHVNSHNLEGIDDLVGNACDDAGLHFPTQKMGDTKTNIKEQHEVDDAMPTDKVPSSFNFSAECVDMEIATEVIIHEKESSTTSCTHESQSQLLEDGDTDKLLTSSIILGEGQADVLSSTKLETSALTGRDILAGKSELHKKLNILNAENLSILEPKMDLVLQSDQKSCNGEVESLTESLLNKDGTTGDIAGISSLPPLDIGEDFSSLVTTKSASKAESLGFLVPSYTENTKALNDSSAVIADGSLSIGSSKDILENEVPVQLSDVCKTGDASLDTAEQENKNLYSDVIDKSQEQVIPPQPDALGNTEPGEEEERDARTSLGASSITLSRSDQVAAEVVNSPCDAKFDAQYDSVASQHLDTDEKLTVVAKGILSTTDSLRDSCSSPTTISPDVQIPDEKKQDGVEGSVFASKPSTSEDSKVKDTSGDDNSFTFKVNSLPDVGKAKNKNWTPFPIATMHKPSFVLEAVTTPNADKIHARFSPETSSPSPVEHAHEMTKPTSGRKKRASGKGASKENLLTGFNGNEITPDKPSRKRANFSSFSLTTGSGQPGQSVGLQPHTEQKRKKVSSKAVAPASDLPDLNAAALKNYGSPSTVFQQSFTDLQQVQLRAQIFVYGSLIQGTTPDETCMVSAFGSSDRERGLWQPVWQAAMERVRSKKSQSMSESPMTSFSSGAKVPEIADKQVTPKNKVFLSPVSRAVSNQTTILSPILPFSSPLWSISTPLNDASHQSSQQRRPALDYQPAVPRLHPYQIPPVHNMAGLTTWPSQAACSPSLWASQTPVVSLNTPLTNARVSEKMKLSPLKDSSLPTQSCIKESPSSSLPTPSCVKDSPSTPLVPTGGSSNVLERGSCAPDQTKSALSSELPFTDPKPRKRKKSKACNDIPQNPLLFQSQSEPIVASPLPASAPLSPVTTFNCHVTTSTAEVSPACVTPQVQVARLDGGTSSACSEETLSKVRDAKLQAEEAAVSAATAISHCEGLWCQLAKLEPGTSQEAEAKLAAAAGAAIAAVCVAKAAAAAARVASSAALQAKLMADEALGQSKLAGGTKSEYLVSNMHSMGSATPALILTGDGGSTQSSTILLAAREAANRRIEAASAAAKQAENLDAILKAAELAAEAVSQAGKIVAMGEPLPLKEIINAGPEGYWKLSQGSKLVNKSCDENKEKNSADGAVVCGKENSAKSLGLEENEAADRTEHAFISEDNGGLGENLCVGNNHEVFDIIEGQNLVDDSAQCDREELSVVQGNNIREGSIVEVYKDSEGLKPAWFSANVLTLQDGKAFVHYASLLSTKGSESLKEWVALEGEGGKAPRIRPALPIIGTDWQKTKKRRRSAMGSYSWSIKDMVDVSIQDSWWEGIVTEKNEKDETTLTVHFPARGETSAVSVQQLRPSRIWSNGSWVEWSRLRGHEHISESDMPLEKRPRLQSPSRNSKEKNQPLDGAELAAGKPEPSKLHTLTADNKVFNIGQSSKIETKPGVRRTLRAGLQKEKSRVVFGVPKPGKKQKFMEVSKHFSTNQNKKDKETKDPVKFAKYLIPQQGATARVRKIQPKVDTKETQTPKVFASKARTSSTRTLPQKRNNETPIPPSPGVDTETSEENISNIPRSSSETNAVEKPLSKIDEEKATADGSEPRRSHRRFQPTHRLLEGFQSSLVIPKMAKVASVSKDDKGQGEKSRVRSAFGRGK